VGIPSVTRLHVVSDDDLVPSSSPPPVVIGTDTETGEPVSIPYEARDEGLSLVGRQGTGKSTVLERLILADLQHSTPGIVIDPHGRLAQRVIEIATPEQAERIVLLEADETAPFGLNLFAVSDPNNAGLVSKAAKSVVTAIKKLYGQQDEYLPRLEYYLDLAARTLIPNRRTLADVPRLIRDAAFRSECLKNISNREIRSEWQEYELLRTKEQLEHIEVVRNRLSVMLRDELIRGIVGSPHTTMPFNRVLNGDTMLIVSLLSERITKEQCNFIGTLLLIAFSNLLFARETESGKPPRLHIYLDEYQRFATSTTGELLQEGRKYGAGLTLAHQNFTQVTDPDIRSISTRARTLIVLEVEKKDADILAGNFRIEPRPERLEEIEEEDGTEPVYVFSPTPAEDIFPDRHSDPDVAAAARALFAGSRPNPAFVRFEVDSLYYDPPGTPGPREIYAVEANKLLLQAMNGHLTSDVLFDFFFRNVLFLDFANKSPDYYPYAELTKPEVEHNVELSRRPFPSSRSIGPPRGPSTSERERSEKRAKNILVKKVYNAERRHWIEVCLRDWLTVQCEHMDALRAGEYIAAFKDADMKLEWQADTFGWDELTLWKARVNTSDRRNPFAFRPTQPGGILKLFLVDSVKTGKAVESLRERMRLLLVIADGLQRQPVRVATGEQKPRTRTRFVPRPGQSWADAKDEMANRLVNPSGQWVARVHQPDEDHETKLLPQMRGTTDLSQVALVRKRSRALYRVASTADIATPPVASSPAGSTTDSVRMPVVSRRPGGLPQEPPEPVADNAGSDSVEAAGAREEAASPVIEFPKEPGPPEEAKEHNAGAVQAPHPDPLWWDKFFMQQLKKCTLRYGPTVVISYTGSEFILQTGDDEFLHQERFTRVGQDGLQRSHRNGVVNYPDTGKPEYFGWTDPQPWHYVSDDASPGDAADPVAQPRVSVEPDEAAETDPGLQGDPDLLWWEEYTKSTIEAVEGKDSSAQLIACTATELVFQTGVPAFWVQHRYTRVRGRNVQVWHRSGIPDIIGQSDTWSMWLKTRTCPAPPVGLGPPTQWEDCFLT
jgi:hypothetical protein